MKKINVLIVDDSRTTRQMFTQVISGTPDLNLVGEALDGEEAVKMTLQLKPDIVLMDIVMPRKDGLQATREIMNTRPTPVVLVSASVETYETDIAFQAIRAGALTVLRKPAGPASDSYAAEMSMVLSTLRVMSSVRVIHHWGRGQDSPTGSTKSFVPNQGEAGSAGTSEPTMLPQAPLELVSMVSSTGGPAALSEILRQLPRDFPLPIVIVQHIAPDFVASLVQWLQTVTRLKVQVARMGDEPLPGTVTLAPGNKHLRIGGLRTFDLISTPDNAIPNSKRHMPCGDVLLESVARQYGPAAVGVVLTGMGDDGARGLRAMYDAGAYTIAQNEATSVVYGMPAEAARQGAVRQVAALQDIAQILVNLVAQEVKKS